MVVGKNVFKHRLNGYKSKLVYAPNGSLIKTTSFAPLFDQSIKFSLCFVPRTKKHGGSVSLFLVLCSRGNNNKVDVCFKFWIEDRSGNRFCESEVLRHTFDDRIDKFGLHSYQKRETLLSDKFKVIKEEDGFFICCDVRAGNEIEDMKRIPEVQVEPAVVLPTPRKRKADDTSTVNLPYGDSEIPEKLSLPSRRGPSLYKVTTFQKTSTPKATLSRLNAPLPSLSTMSDSIIRELAWKLYLGGSHDAIINADGTKFKVLKHILTFQSGFFYRVFTSDDSKVDFIDIKDVSASKIESLIKWFYLAELEPDISIKRLFRIFSLAYKYDIPKLKDDCVQQMLPHLTTDNLCFFLITAIKYQNERLLASLVYYIPRNPTEDYLRKFFESPDWIRVNQNNRDIANEILEILNGQV